MKDYNLGKIEKISNLRDVWENEERNFTTWLIEEENMELLSETVGVPIVVDKNEASVGKYWVDILAHNGDTNDVIVIENQIEQTDHDHLGKLLVYAAGYKANTMIWIAKEADKEHIEAVNWLNENTSEEVNAFLIKIELLRIDDSRQAPYFQIICQPNNWAKTIRSRKLSADARGIQLTYMKFFEGFKNYANSKGFMDATREPRGDNCFCISFGVSDAVICLNTDKKAQMSCSLYIENNKDLFNKLKDNKDEIEKELGLLTWDNKEGKKAANIFKACNFKANFNSDKNEKAYEWYLSNAREFIKVFKKYI